jgi:hypothetical protein
MSSRNKHIGPSLDSLFEETGELEEINARAAKRVLAIDAAQERNAYRSRSATVAHGPSVSRR